MYYSPLFVPSAQYISPPNVLLQHQITNLQSHKGKIGTMLEQAQPKDNIFSITPQKNLIILTLYKNKTQSVKCLFLYTKLQNKLYNHCLA